jgi:hypothetical protein
VFGRSKTPAAQEAVTTVDASAKEGGKGRPTPKRREREQANRRPIVGAGAAVKPGATKEERKAARAARRESMQGERAKSRAALMGGGDERNLPVRDRGPAKRYARNVVDSRRNVGEYFLFFALIAVVLSFLRPAAMFSIVVLYGVMLLVIADSVFLYRKVQRGATAKFGEAEAKGTGRYAIMRAVQLRRARLPRPAVGRGEFKD